MFEHVSLFDATFNAILIVVALCLFFIVLGVIELIARAVHRLVLKLTYPRTKRNQWL